MCGIVGVYCFDRTRAVDGELLVRQTDTLVHRGPDDGGAYVGPGIGLGQRRLSIIDLGGGHQPMWDLEKRLVVVFNGEIYNFKELMTELESRGHRFQTQSDTEVILNGYREWGATCVDRFIGMFAFALYDTKTHGLFLARDRLGKKPLYYHRDAERIVFASELKAIIEDRSIARVLDPTAVVDYFAYNYVPGPGTILRDIHKLAAAHYLVAKDGRTTERRYWDVDFSRVEDKSLDEDAAALAEELQGAVTLRLRSDVPLGAFLSGGIDSSLIVSSMARALPGRVKTNTIGFVEDGYDERAFARETAELYGTEHTEKVVSVDALDVVPKLAWYYDEPFGDSSAVPTYYLSKATREQVTVALSGDGGDESFAGYRRYQFAMAEHEVRERVPAMLRKAVVRPIAGLYPKADYLPRYLRAKATLTNIAESHERAYFLSLTQKTYPRFLAKDFLRGVGAYDPYIHFERCFARCASKDPLSRLQYVDLALYLCDDILVKVDRASMAHALEVRVPLLDHRIVELAARMKPSHKLRGSESKVVVRRVAENALPPSILGRKKMGFTIPLPEWFRGGLAPMAEEIFFGKKGGTSGLIDTQGLRRMWYEHQLGVRNNATVFWSLLMFESWAQRFLAPGAAKGPVVHAKPTRVEARVPG
jgi:asparagine synthase (glutamine-hydrolysing)